MDKAFQSYLNFLTTNPVFILNCFRKYYEQFNIPNPTKEEILSIALKITKTDNVPEEKQLKIKEVLEQYIELIMDESEE